MALVKCRECGHDVSDSARRCPGCGCKVVAPQPLAQHAGSFVRKHPSSKTVLWILLAVGALVAFKSIVDSDTKTRLDRADAEGRRRADARAR